MTREQAEEIVFKSQRRIRDSWGDSWGGQATDSMLRVAANICIDEYESLGLLQLDKPQPLNERVLSALAKGGWPGSGRDVISILEAAGFEVVEKTRG